MAINLNKFLPVICFIWRIVDFYADWSQHDGLIKKISIYQDFKRLILLETRWYFRNRRDKLYLRRRFPYEYKLIEYYESSDKTNYWKKLIQIDGHLRQLYFYHHRNNDKNKDGLIYREEQIGSKTIEKYKDREDHLEYRSVEFIPIPKNQKDATMLELKDIHFKCAKILNMVQKFGLNHEMPAEDQIRMTEFNIEKGDVFIYYHYKDGKITANQNSFKCKDLIGNSSAVDEMNNKEVVENALQQKQKKIHEMEIECHHQINAQEETAGTERDARTSKEKEIMSHRFNNDQEVIFKDILEKSYYDKARDKMKQGKKKEEEDTGKEQEKDYLWPILDKLKFTEIAELSQDQAMEVKNVALQRLKERLLTRAEIIQRRLEAETKALQDAFQSLKRKGEHTTDDDEHEYEKKVTDANFKIEILTERASHHYKNSLTKFNELDQKLMNDPRLKALRNDSG